jgi:hypothetical protein
MDQGDAPRRDGSGRRWRAVLTVLTVLQAVPDSWERVLEKSQQLGSDALVELDRLAYLLFGLSIVRPVGAQLEQHLTVRGAQDLPAAFDARGMGTACM